MGLYNVNGMALLSDACTGTLETFLLYYDGLDSEQHTTLNSPPPQVTSTIGTLTGTSFFARTMY